MASQAASFNSHTSNSEPYGASSAANDFDGLSRLVSSNIQTMTRNVAQMQTLLSQYRTRSDSLELRDQLHQVQRQTNQLAKDTGVHIKDLNRFPPPSASLEQRQQKLQRERLTDEFMKVLNSFQSVQRLEKEMEKSSVIEAQRSPTAAYNPFGDDVITHNRPQKSDQANVVEIAGGRQQMSLQLEAPDIDYELLQEREDALRKLEADIVDVNEIFKDLGMLVHEQGDMIDSIEANVESAAVSVEQGTEQLTRARNYQSKARKKKCILCTIFLVILIVLIIVIVVVVKARS